MEKNKRHDLKNKIEELVNEKLSKFKKQKAQEEDIEEEEEKCIEPFLLIDPETGERMFVSEDEMNAVIDYCAEEGIELQYVEDLEDVKNLNEVLNEEVCPSVEIDEEEIEYIPINEVELDDDEIQELNEVAEEIKPLGDLLALPCEVNGKNCCLVDTVNCNIRPVPLLGIYVVAPVNMEIVKILLDADMQSDEEIEVNFLVNTAYNDADGDAARVHMVMNLQVLVNAGIVALVGIAGDEPLKLSALEFRGMTVPVSIKEFNNLF